MKKVCLSLGAALVALSGSAAERILYQQNFETATDAAATGWSYGGESMTIGSDDYGKFLDLALGNNNSRSGMVKWGQEIFLNENGEPLLEDGTYNVAFDFSIKAVPNKDNGCCFTIFTNHEPVANQNFRLPWNPAGQWNNFVVSIDQTNTEVLADMEMAVNAPIKETVTTNDSGEEVINYSVDNAEAVTFATGAWFSVTATVNVNNRTVEYFVANIAAPDEPVASGTWTVPETDGNGEAISMYAEGMYVMTARFWSEFLVDNIKVSYESKYDYANPPTITLTRLGKDADETEEILDLRAYSITFLDGETLHIEGTDGNTDEVEYADCDGAYLYETTTSGSLKAWTTSGTATSDMVEVEVDCSPCVLPAAEVAITAVEAGYGKTYTLTVSNADVPLQPVIFLSYEFNGADGTVLSASDLGSGAKVNVPGEGVLTVTTESFGYQSTSVSVDNNIEYVIKKDYDFAHMSKEELAAAGFTTWNTLNSGNTSGFDNWTARKRMFYWDAATERVNEETGETEYDAVYPFGFIADDNTTNVIEYSEIYADANTAESKHFDGIQVYVGHNLCALYRIGVYNNETGGGNNKNIDVPGLAATDVVVANKINGYGANSVHPICASDEEYYAQIAGENFVYLPVEDTTTDEEGNTVGLGTYSVHVDVYRIDTTCARLTIYAQNGGGNGVDAIGTESVKNNDPWYYTIDGLRVAEPTRPGLYIHQGKKVIVRK